MPFTSRGVDLIGTLARNLQARVREPIFWELIWSSVLNLRPEYSPLYVGQLEVGGCKRVSGESPWAASGGTTEHGTRKRARRNPGPRNQHIACLPKYFSR